MDCVIYLSCIDKLLNKMRWYEVHVDLSSNRIITRWSRIGAIHKRRKDYVFGHTEDLRHMLHQIIRRKLTKGYRCITCHNSTQTVKLTKDLPIDIQPIGQLWAF